MIEILILFELNRKILTMYGISKQINNDFSVITTPSFGTIKPALVRLVNGGFVRTQKTLSKGGRPSCYYSITDLGVEELKRLIIGQPVENPVQFLTSARIKLACADVLNSDEFTSLINNLKMKAKNILLDTENMITSKELSFYPKMVYDNLNCEYKNFILLLEGLKNAGSR